MCTPPVGSHADAPTAATSSSQSSWDNKDQGTMNKTFTLATVGLLAFLAYLIPAAKGG